MDHTGGCTDVNQTMQELPPLASQSDDPIPRRSNSEGNQHHKARITGHDEWPLREIIDHSVESKELIEPDIADEMQHSVKECEQPQHTPRSDNFVPSSNSADWCDRQRDEEKAQCPDTGRVANRLERIRPKIAVRPCPDKKDRRQRARQEQVEAPINSSCVNPFPHTYARPAPHNR